MLLICIQRHGVGFSGWDQYRIIRDGVCAVEVEDKDQFAPFKGNDLVCVGCEEAARARLLQRTCLVDQA